MDTLFNNALLRMGALAYLQLSDKEPTLVLIESLDSQFLELYGVVESIPDEQIMLNHKQLLASITCTHHGFRSELERLGKFLGIDIDLNLMSESKFIQKLQN